MFFCEFILQFFNFGAYNLDDSAAFYADEMVVVLVLVFMLKRPLAIPEICFSCQAGIAYNLHSAVNGSEADFWVFLSYEDVEFFNGGVVFSF